MTEVGVGYVTLIPSMTGFSAKAERGLAEALKGPARRSGDDAGRLMVSSLSDGIDAGESKVKGAASRLGDVFKVGLAGVGLAAGAALTAGLGEALGQEQALAKFEAQLGGGAFAKEAGDVAGRLYTDGFGESVADTADAVKQVLQAGLGDGLSSDQLEDLTAQALTFSDVLDQDVNMSLQAVDKMLATGLADSAEQAFDIMTRGIQGGGDMAGDLAETFQEYSTQFRELGLSGADAAGLMLQGVGAGARDADAVADALKEMAIQAKSGSQASSDAFRALGLNAADMRAAFLTGGDAARDGLGQVLDGLRELDGEARQTAVDGLFAGLGENLQQALVGLDLGTASSSLGAISGATDDLGTAYLTAGQRIENFKRQTMQKLVDFLGNVVIPGLENLAAVVGPVVSQAFETVRGVIDQIDFERIGTQVVGLADAIQPAVETIVTFAQENLPKLGELFTSVFELIETVVQRVIDVVSFIWTNFGDEIMAATQIVWDLISGVFSGSLDTILGIVQLVTSILQGDWSAAGEALKKITSGIWKVIKTIFRAGLQVLKLAVKTGFTVIKALLRAALTKAVSAVRSKIDSIVGFFRGLPGRVRTAFSTLASAISSPFRRAFDSLKWLWNNTVGGFGFSVPSWIPGVGGKGFSIPSMHTGGLFQAPSGRSEGLALLQSGERVLSRRDTAAFDSLSPQRLQPAAVAIQVNFGGGDSRLLDEYIRSTVRVVGGGSVQRTYGRGGA